MKLGVITDIHNNLTALKAVIESLNQLKCDKIVCCGDIIGIGPYPEETVQFLMKIPNLLAVRGNHEQYLLDGMPNEFPNEEQMSIEEKKHHEWEHRLLSVQSVDFLKNLPYRIDVEYEGYHLTIMHYCMNQNNRYVHYKVNPTKRDLKKMYRDVRSDIIIFGHNHHRNICKGDKLYVNVGSLGCPAQDKNLARAGMITIEQGKVIVEPIDIEYDVNTVIKMINEINYPEAENIKRIFYGIS